MCTASPDLHALTLDDEEWSETSRQKEQAIIYTCNIEEYINKSIHLSTHLRNTMTEVLTGSCGMGLFVRPAAIAG